MTPGREDFKLPFGSPPPTTQAWMTAGEIQQGTEINTSPNDGGSGREKSAFTPIGRGQLSTTTMKSPENSNGNVASNQTKASRKKSSMKKTPHHSHLFLSPSRTITESLTALVSSTARQLEDVWDEVGYNPEERTSQLSDLLVQCRDLCEAKVAEEQGVAETFRHTIAETKAEIAATAKALQAHVDVSLLEGKTDEQSNNKTTLTDELAILEATLEGLREAAAISKNDLKECQDFLIESHDLLGLKLDEEWNDIESDLTMGRREKFHQKVDEMKEEIRTRSAAVIQLLRDCQHLINDLRIDIQDGNGSLLDQQISGSLVRGKDGTYNMASNFRTETCTGISSCALEDLTRRVAELNAEKRRRTTKLEEMGANIMSLWEKLRVSEEEQRAFSETIQGLGLDTIEKGEAELQRLHALKSEMLGKLVMEARETILGLWEEINATEEFRKNFSPYFVKDEYRFTDELLEEHENYIEQLKAQFEEMKPILRIIERREVILQERIEYQELQKDSDRLKQRGAALTKQLMEEEKMAKRIKRDLPKLTNMLGEKLQEWREKHGEEFQLNGEDYANIMERQEEEWNRYKEREMQLKLKKKQGEKNLSENQHLKGTTQQPPKRKAGGRPLGDARSKDNIRGRSRSRDVGPLKQRTGHSRSRTLSTTRV